VLDGRDSPEVVSTDQGDKLALPDTTKYDIMVTAIKAALAGVPFVGGSAAEIVGYGLTWHREKRHRELFEAVLDDLERLHVHVESLDDSFYAVASHAAQLATLTNEQEKLAAYRNIIVNSALPTSPDEEMRELFLTMVASLTGRHIRVLDAFINSPKYGIGVTNSADFQVIGGTKKVISEHVPGFERPDILERCINDLINQRLVYYQGDSQVREARLLELMGNPLPTELAYDFVAFISQPPELAHADQAKEQDG
jgi:hypothetical protein